jgi:hypothetical protein
MIRGCSQAIGVKLAGCRWRHQFDQLQHFFEGGGSMNGLGSEALQEPVQQGGAQDTKPDYAVPYFKIRIWVGILGLALPTTLFLLDWALLNNGLLFRGSLSAYYYSGARDVFVGVLTITGFMLIIYMAGQRSGPRWRESRLSTIAGVAGLFVALFPKKRPGLEDTSVLCGPDADPVPEGCTRLQQVLGEMLVAWIHFVAAGLFILALAAICLFVFAKREKAVGDTRERNEARLWIYRVSGYAIVAAVLWIPVGGWLGFEPFGWTPLLVGEVVSVYAFAISWIVIAYDLLRHRSARLKRESEVPIIML